ncbi:MAG: putative toxin-antitoxin system toxin component, PIN family, partial [Selenomonadaceae bacterium]|nr:putative toxin-antitoxin system toxin component, PIN family [Selenomonadaceae bacterium]
MNFYAVIDTNVLVSAMLKDISVPRKILDLAFVGKIIPLLNDKILAEYEEVISRPKFKNTQESIDFFMNGMKNHGIFV